ncbi:MAG: hypothetical protein JWP95_331 [Actinotalea sp.]|nr:hypothetical protein [Actinotalea sp.]
MTDAPTDHPRTPDDDAQTAVTDAPASDQGEQDQTGGDRPARVKGPRQTMKPMKAAKKLGIHLPAAPESFREAPAVTRSDIARLMTDPPEWLVELRRTGPHPREVVASRLGVSIAGLVRGGAGDALLTTEIDELRSDPPPWLVRERANLARVRAEEDRLAREKPAAPRPAAPGRGVTA